MLKLHNFNILRALAKIQINSKKINKIFSDYPDSPDLYLLWRKRLRQFLLKGGILERDEIFDDFMRNIVEKEKIDEESIEFKTITN